MIGNAQDLSALPDASVDFVIANHLVEHLENPIAALAEFHRVLRRDGVLYLALPDPRVSFDRDRELTSVEHLLDEYRNGTERNRLAHYLDWAIKVDNHADPDAHAARLMEMDYSIHFHVWRPDSFLDFLLAARREARLDFELAAYAPPESPEDNEFILVLLNGTSGVLRLPPDSRVMASSDGARLPARGRVERWADLRARVRKSRIGPILAPAYRFIRRRWSTKARFPRGRGTSRKGPETL